MSTSHPLIHSCWVCCREESSEIDVAGGLYVLFGSGKLESIYRFHSRYLQCSCLSNLVVFASKLITGCLLQGLFWLLPWLFIYFNLRKKNYQGFVSFSVFFPNPCIPEVSSGMIAQWEHDRFWSVIIFLQVLTMCFNFVKPTDSLKKLWSTQQCLQKRLRSNDLQICAKDSIVLKCRRGVYLMHSQMVIFSIDSLLYLVFSRVMGSNRTFQFCLGAGCNIDFTKCNNMRTLDVTYFSFR